ncbi:hypothetical protein CXG81DRAFT_11153 [Caulochytrium protostelioides]|uniref:Radial spoke head protein 9 homolog n=1 Tax=Caulochytrium protostelioides TaxID=1555241 RepID=A0A4P9XAH0_9FUNG|nr:hypothetical protein CAUPRSCDRAFT_6099 [Caulochytrium protostelioides]RKP02130.1 hypothetical protein CXG81DRAFT_11153 [Caulochytrium protostelioides]|eukprot:RKP02130.1 hypothetical protein CXG81DRAFT_11153 [Caulochytrium protostelioides]
MSFFDLADLPYLQAAGTTLDQEERASLAVSLPVKQNQERLPNIALWGKIQGVSGDYLVAQSWSDDAPFERKFYYQRGDRAQWLQLPEVSTEDLETFAPLGERFKGDPAFEITASAANGETRTINEEKRLAIVVMLITYDLQTVPRGAYYRDSTSRIVRNPAYAGLSESEALSLTNFYHFQPNVDINEKSISERSGTYVESLDIFRSLAQDRPIETWSSQQADNGRIRLLRSRQWPGYLFWAVLGTPKFGGLYVGTGVRNNDLGFMA